MSNGLKRVEEIFQDRGNRARELETEGRKIIGYMCTFTPVEIISAAGLVPFRIAGNMREPITEAGQFLEAIACPFTRSVLDLALKGQYSFLDGFVIPHACDNIVKLYDLWAHNIDHSYAHFVNVPHTLSNPSFEFFKAELGTFKRSLEKYTGNEIGTDALNQAIRSHNRQRVLVRQLYEFRKNDPPLISGAEITRVLVASMSLPADEANELLEAVIAEVGKRESISVVRKGSRLMIYGTGNEDTVFIELVESLGGNVVIDDLCFGTRGYWFDVDTNGDPLEGIARSYLGKINCPRTFRQSPGNHAEDLENRFGHIYQLFQEFKADGIILFILRYCDTHAFDIPDLREYLESRHAPVLLLEEEYPVESSLDRLRTRVETFLEIIA